ncbi:MAG TPA: GNAT family N-acetyltransferase [Bdellovibrio sp.]|nr:GNAT family N-acetyltransferase [Bdellovibrio sp.]
MQNLIPTLQTERLILRPLRLEDAQGGLKYIQNPNVTRYTMWDPYRSVEEAQGFIQMYVFANYANGAPEPLGIALRSNPSELIGTTGCFWVGESQTQMELAYVLAEEFWGHGYATEASKAIMDYCFQIYKDVVRIQARCKVENTASVRVLEKLGMKFEGTLRSQFYHRQRHWDIHYYATIRE